MPTTRRSAANARGRPGPVKGQSTISFTGKVTKPIAQDVKKVIDTPVVAVERDIPERLARVKKDDVDVSKAKAEEKGEEATEEVEATEEQKAELDDEQDEEVEEAEELEEEEGLEAKVAVFEKSEAEVKAEAITDSQIKSYWKDIEDQRKAPRIHQNGLDLSEKVLRYFDVSSQYGPCIGTTRLKRWQRAERLGLNPPIEVLAVLIREEARGADDIQTAQVDRILNAPVVAA